jgi:YHS domain-containing protein
MRLTPLLAGAAVAAGLATLSITLARAGDAPAAPPRIRVGNATCPVKGTPVDPQRIYVWNDLEIGYCCSECPSKFAANPAAYLPALVRDLATQLADAKARLAKYEKPAPSPAAPPASAGPTPAPALIDLGNARCPVMPAMAAKPAVFTDYHGMRIHFCCPMCPPKFNADPQAYLNAMRADPAMAKRIDDAETAWSAAHPR